MADEMPGQDAVGSIIEAAFRRVHRERMNDVPILNSALEVRVVGLMPWERFWLGILITPWFMNVILLPKEAEAEAVRMGEKRLFVFPVGSFEFIRGQEDGTGPFWMCSLFSPVLEFADMDTALTAASSALVELLEAEPDDPDHHMQRIWKGELPEPDEVVNPEENSTLADVPEGMRSDRVPRSQEIDRRGLLTGQLLGRE